MKFNEKLFEEDIDLFMRTFAEAYCKEAQKLLVIRARSVIEDYYKAKVFRDQTSNEPLYYDRTDDFKRNSYIPHYKNNGNRIYGGIKFSTKNMSDYKYGTYSTMDVLQLAIHGIHGNTLYRSEAPLNALQDYMRSKSFLEALNESAAKAVHNTKYNYLNKII